MRARGDGVEKDLADLGIGASPQALKDQAAPDGRLGARARLGWSVS